LLPEVTGRNVLIVDDIFDTGHTPARLVEEFAARDLPNCARPCCCGKAGRVQVSMNRHVGFEIPDEFVVGYVSTTAISSATCVRGCLEAAEFAAAKGPRRGRRVARGRS